MSFFEFTFLLTFILCAILGVVFIWNVNNFKTTKLDTGIKYAHRCWAFVIVFYEMCKSSEF